MLVTMGAQRVKNGENLYNESFERIINGSYCYPFLFSRKKRTKQTTKKTSKR